jgi:membrane protease YdiL (CAAX protease family)
MTNGSEPLAAQLQPPATARPWGYLATFGWAFVAYIVATAITTGLLYLWDPETTPSDMDFSALMKDARYVSLTTIISNVLLIGILLWATSRRGWKSKDYLAMSWPPRQEVVVALISLLIVLLLIDGLAYVAGQPIIPPFMTDIYRNAQSTGSLLVLWLAIVVAAPVAEEIVFRGFFFRGWVRPTPSPMLGIVLVTALFAVIHIQYNWFGIFQVFLIGFLLTWTRWRSGSTLLPMLMHVIANCYAMLQVTFVVEWLS